MSDIRDYPFASFTSSSGVVNPRLFKKELEDLGLSVSVFGVAADSSCKVILLDTPTAGDLTAIDGAIAAHLGTPDGDRLQRSVSEAEVSDDSGDEQVKVSLTTGPLAAGVYQIGWYMEMAQTTLSTTTGARGRLMVTKNSGSAIERAQQNVDIDQWQVMSGSLSEDVGDADDYTFELTYERIGTSGNAARARFGRITWVRIGAAVI